jgi:hypothetical protein
MRPQPTIDEVEAVFVAVVDGRLNRDDADRWARLWIDDDGLVFDELTWWALTLLHGIDLPAGPADGYLHDDNQVRDWLRELQYRRASRRRGSVAEARQLR